MSADRGAILREQDAALRRELDELGADPDRDEVTFDADRGFSDRSASTEERGRILATAAALRANLREVERALQKLAEGSGAVCDRCGGPISDERLEAIAWATLCIDCKRATG